EEAQRRPHIQKRRRRVQPHRGSVAAPRPIIGGGNKAGSHRVHDDVLRKRQKVVVMINDLRFESPLKYMADSSMPLVPPECVTSVDSSDRLGEIRRGGLESRVIVIGHQAV